MRVRRRWLRRGEAQLQPAAGADRAPTGARVAGGALGVIDAVEQRQPEALPALGLCQRGAPPLLALVLSVLVVSAHGGSGRVGG